MFAKGQTLQLARKKCMARGCFNIQRNNFGERDSPLFTAVLSEMDLGYVDTREAQVFV